MPHLVECKDYQDAIKKGKEQCSFLESFDRDVQCPDLEHGYRVNSARLRFIVEDSIIKSFKKIDLHISALEYVDVSSKTKHKNDDAAQDVDPAQLHVISHHAVVNPESKSVIWQAAIFSKAIIKGEHQYCEFGPGNDGFYAILGCTNGKSTMRMLRDHKETLQYRTVERVILLPNVAVTVEEPETRTFAIVLYEPRSRPASS
ncbi:MAG: hypothetical protein Q9160_008667 [Pyrenula sp. 1 TL-2023]